MKFEKKMVNGGQIKFIHSYSKFFLIGILAGLALLLLFIVGCNVLEPVWYYEVKVVSLGTLLEVVSIALTFS